MCAHNVRTMCAQRAHNVRTVCAQCAHSVRIMCTQCAHNVRTLCAQCVHSVYTVCEHCANTAQAFILLENQNLKKRVQRKIRNYVGEQKGCAERIAPIGTLSQNGYGEDLRVYNSTYPTTNTNDSSFKSNIT